jgi:hypothetical protein
MTPDSPVGRFIRLNFSQDNIKLVSRVFGTQVLRRSFQPFGCSRRLCTTSDRQSMILYKQCLWKGGHTVAPALREAEWISEGVSTPFSEIPHELSSLGWKGWNYTQNFPHSS